MNVLLINCPIYVGTENQARLQQAGHRIIKIDYESGNPEHNMQALLSQVPAEFSPDLTVVWSADYHGIPQGIEQTPGHTVIQVNDFHLCHTPLLPHLSRFDAIWTDQLGVRLYGDLGFANIIDAPLYSFAADIPEFARPEKDIDIIFVGAINHVVHWERSHWLRRLARLCEKYKVLVAGGIPPKEYYQTLARGKIIFNQGMRREMNMRCFEGPALEGLLLMEEENLECQKYFPPGEAAAYYNTYNFEDVIDYYVSHSAERERMISTSKNIAQKMKCEQIFQLIEHAARLPEPERAQRGYPNVSKAAQNIAHGSNVIYKTKPRSYSFGETIFRQALALEEDNKEAWNNLAITHYRQCIHADLARHKNLLQDALQELQKSIACGQNYLPAHYNLAQLCFDLGFLDQAKTLYLRLQRLASKSDIQEDDLRGLLYPDLYGYFSNAVQRIAIEHTNKHALRVREHKLLYKLSACIGLGATWMKQGKLESALPNLLEAMEYSQLLTNPLPQLYQLLADATWELDEKEASITFGTHFDALEPFNMDFWDVHLERLLSTRNFKKALAYATEYSQIAQSYTLAHSRIPVYSKLRQILEQENDLLLGCLGLAEEASNRTITSR